MKDRHGLTVVKERGLDWSGDVRFFEHKLLEPIKRKKPTRYFVNSMSDLFHPSVRDEWIDKIFAVMALCSRHTFMVLTKRPERMRQYMTAARAPAHFEYAGEHMGLDQTSYLALVERVDELWPRLPNVQLGVSVWDQTSADEMLPPLMETPAAVRFVSAEPLIGPINLYKPEWIISNSGFSSTHIRGVLGEYTVDGKKRRGLDQVIVGAESGPGARPMDEDWVRSIRDQCAAAGTALFYKQRMVGGRKVSLPKLDGHQHAEFPK